MGQSADRVAAHDAPLEVDTVQLDPRSAPFIAVIVVASLAFCTIVVLKEGTDNLIAVLGGCTALIAAWSRWGGPPDRGGS